MTLSILTFSKVRELCYAVSVVVLNVTNKPLMLNVTMPDVIMLSIVMLSVMALR